MIECEKILSEAEAAAKKHSDQLDSQYAFQVGYLKGCIYELCAIIENTRSELKRVQEELNSIGEL